LHNNNSTLYEGSPKVDFTNIFAKQDEKFFLANGHLANGGHIWQIAVLKFGLYFVGDIEWKVFFAKLYMPATFCLVN